MRRFLSFVTGLLLAVTLVPSSQAFAATSQFLVTGPEIGAPRGFVDMCRHERSFCGDVRALRASGATASNHTVPPMSYVAATATLADPPFSTPSGEDWAIGPVRKKRHKLGLANDSHDYPLLFGKALLDSGPPDEKELLDRVNRTVNGRVTQETDQEVYGQPELWHRSGVRPGAAGDCEDIAIEKRFQLVGVGFDPKRLFFAVVFLPQTGLHTVLVAHTADGDLVLDSRTSYVDRWDQTSYSWIAIQSPEYPMIWHSLMRNAVN